MLFEGDKFGILSNSKCSIMFQIKMVHFVSQLSPELREKLMEKCVDAMRSLDNRSMKEFKGLDKRLAGLEQLMIQMKAFSDSQSDMTQVKHKTVCFVSFVNILSGRLKKRFDMCVPVDGVVVFTRF